MKTLVTSQTSALVPHMPDIEITKEGVEILIRNLYPSKASGSDNMHLKAFKELSSCHCYESIKQYLQSNAFDSLLSKCHKLVN